MFGEHFGRSDEAPGTTDCVRGLLILVMGNGFREDHVRVTPMEIAPTPDGSKLSIEWADGETSVLAPFDLRLACPCAGCVDELTGNPVLHPGRVGANVYPESIHYVGRYALQFNWSDGHNTGIYPFRYLRQLGDKADAGG